ncbi:hypothetical protein D5086_012625 [Populus alba]|uniref:Uncharacterized protein n=1 Tax=Populus alba TaxID=43335 RepID=A0ACC4C3E3_POPAL
MMRAELGLKIYGAVLAKAASPVHLLQYLFLSSLESFQRSTLRKQRWFNTNVAAYGAIEPTTEDASLVTEQHCFKCMVISYYYDYASLPLQDRINKGGKCRSIALRSETCAIYHYRRIYHQLCVGAGSLPHGTIIR